jgi:N-ethylmaleimide reductase
VNFKEDALDLFSPVRIGPHELSNRFVMAPMARARCDDNRVPTARVGEYYAQRASVGLIVSEASSVSPLSVSRPHASAIFLDAHVAGWRKVTDSVHAAGGLIFQQLYHLGRKTDPTRMPDGARPVAPSEIAAKGQVAGANGPVDFALPRALKTEEIAGVVAEFRHAAVNARAAGMDGVEVHGANTYLIDQFLRDGTNKRSDCYGGSVENRARFLLEVVDAVSEIFGADCVGVRVSPHARGDGIDDSDPAATFGHVAAALDARRVAYLHLIEAMVPDIPQAPAPGCAPLLPILRQAFRGPLIVNGAYTRETASSLIAAGTADLVAFGALMIANPDLVERFRLNAPLNEPDRSSFHNGGVAGYTDYPFLQDASG